MFRVNNKSNRTKKITFKKWKVIHANFASLLKIRTFALIIHCIKPVPEWAQRNLTPKLSSYRNQSIHFFCKSIDWFLY